MVKTFSRSVVFGHTGHGIRLTSRLHWLLHQIPGGFVQIQPLISATLSRISRQFLYRIESLNSNGTPSVSAALIVSAWAWPADATNGNKKSKHASNFSSFQSPSNSFLFEDLTHEHIDQRMALKKQIIHQNSMNGAYVFYRSCISEKSHFCKKIEFWLSNIGWSCSSGFSCYNGPIR